MQLTDSAIAKQLVTKAEKLEYQAQTLRSCAETLTGALPPQHQRQEKPSPRAPKAPAKVKPAKAKPEKKAAPKSDDAPRAVKGRMPKVGVQQLYCEDEPARRKKVDELKAANYRRVGAGIPLSPGTYDVRPSGDGDDSSVVLWREIATAETK